MQCLGLKLSRHRRGLQPLTLAARHLHPTSAEPPVNQGMSRSMPVPGSHAALSARLCKPEPPAACTSRVILNNTCWLKAGAPGSRDLLLETSFLLSPDLARGCCRPVRHSHGGSARLPAEHGARHQLCPQVIDELRLAKTFAPQFRQGAVHGARKSKMLGAADLAWQTQRAADTLVPGLARPAELQRVQTAAEHGMATSSCTCFPAPVSPVASCSSLSHTAPQPHSEFTAWSSL